jgi:hypothetical protein
MTDCFWSKLRCQLGAKSGHLETGIKCRKYGAYTSIFYDLASTKKYHISSGSPSTSGNGPM